MTATDVRATPTALWWAGLASLGAGAIHATAVGIHAEHRQTAVAFAVLAAFQLGWGALALMRAPRLVIALGAAGNAVAVAGWVLTRTSGIGFIDGLETSESPGFADTTAAVLAAVAVLAALAYLLAPGKLHLPTLTAAVPAAVAVSVLALAGMVAATDHTHSDGHDHVTTSDEAASATGDDPAHDAGHDHDNATTGDTAHDHTSAPVQAKPYDGTLPVDLSGVPGVTPEQQAEAEALVTTNIEQLPRFADPAAAEAVGYRAIGDAVTGTEHLVNWGYLNDGHNLDAAYPEALVYKVGRGGSRTLEAAMYVLEPPATLDTVPPIGGSLLQYHVHNDLCWAGQDGAYQVLPAAPLPAPCPAGTERRLLEPMVHVWIVGNPCGPFAALEGIGGGQVRPGEEVQCDHAHGVGAL